ncbi:UNVERIFIED_CONTAM: hypothetical protein Sradi_4402600 [Sesamum radiatum]|uniref:Uncharacterized protein n=1 Tax=Sesamum radiatum TaxID=300843 RepID=A0AAW2NS80_SESRA
MPTFLCGVTITVMETAEFILLGALGAVPPRPGACQQSLSFYGHERLCYRYGQMSIDGIQSLKRRLLVSYVYKRFLAGGFLLRLLSLFYATFFFGCLSILHINVFAASNLETCFLARDLKKSPSKSPGEKALAFTSCVADDTSNAAPLNLCKYSFKASLSFCRTAKRLSTVLCSFWLLEN